MVAFRIERLRAGYLVPVTIDDRGGEFRLSTCVCADQAAAAAQRGGERELEYRGMTAMVGGVMVAIEDDMRCEVERGSWTWPLHGWTHGSLRRARGRSRALQQ